MQGVCVCVALLFFGGWGVGFGRGSSLASSKCFVLQLPTDGKSLKHRRRIRTHLSRYLPPETDRFCGWILLLGDPCLDFVIFTGA